MCCKVAEYLNSLDSRLIIIIENFVKRCVQHRCTRCCKFSYIQHVRVFMIQWLTLKYPPWYNVSGGPKIATSHSKRLSSLHNLTRNPSRDHRTERKYSFSTGATHLNTKNAIKKNIKIYESPTFHWFFLQTFIFQIQGSNSWARHYTWFVVVICFVYVSTKEILLNCGHSH